MAVILVVDDRDNIRSSFAMILRREGHKVVLASGVEEAIQRLSEKPVDVLLTDLRMPLGEEGLKVVEAARKLPRRPAVIVVTAYGTIKSAVEAMRLGADDYVEKPLRRDTILEKVNSALKRLEHLQNTASYGFKEIIHSHDSMVTLIEDASRLAEGDDPVLLFGESGTGRRMLARAIHVHSSRARGPFMTVDGSTLETDGLEQIASMGSSPEAAAGQKPILFAQAEEGAVYIDNLDRVHPSAQAGLVALLRETMMSTSTSGHPRNIRIMASTTTDLEAQIRTSQFRSDLFYLISKGMLRVPALRDRPADIPLLAKEFLKQLAAKGRRQLKITKDARKYLLDYNFPGNVRELETLMERAVTIANTDELTPELLERLGMTIPKQEQYGVVFNNEIKMAERETILRVVQRHPRDLAGAAKELGISRTTLWRKMKKFDMIRSKKGGPDDAKEAPSEGTPPTRPAPKTSPPQEGEMEAEA